MEQNSKLSTLHYQECHQKMLSRESGVCEEDAITVLVPIQNRDSLRLKNVLRSLRAQSYASDKIKIFVIDYDSDDSFGIKYRALCEEYEADLYRISYRALWCRAEALNIGLRRVKTKYTLLSDTDIIYSPSYVQNAINELRRDRYRIVHSTVLETGLNAIDHHTDVVRDFFKLRSKALPRVANNAKSTYIFGKGIIAICTEFLFQAQGLDESYYGWGAEDDDLVKRLEKLGLYLYSIADKASYLHHSHPKFLGLPKHINVQLASKSRRPILCHKTTRERELWGCPGAVKQSSSEQSKRSSIFVLQEERKFISVIIPAFDKAELLKKCLCALEKQTFPRESFEIIVVDNNATGDVKGVLQEFPQCVYVYEEQPGSYAARNAGLRHAQGEIVAFTEVDCIAEEDWLQKGHRYFFGPQEAAYVVGHVELFSSKIKKLNLAEGYQQLFWLRSELAFQSANFGFTANLFIRRSVLDQVGWFDATLFSGGDKQLGKKIQELGVKTVYAQEVIVAHPTTPQLKSFLQTCIRSVGGDFQLEKATSSRLSGIALRLLKDEVIQTVCLPRDVIQRAWRQPLRKQLGIVAVGLIVRLVRCREVFRLWMGGQPKRT